MTNRCVGCGYCCQKAQCAAGASIYGMKDGVCAGLQWSEEDQRYYCLLILETVGQANKAARDGLSIGAGCSSAVCNTQREETIAKQEMAYQKRLIAAGLGVPEEMIGDHPLHEFEREQVAEKRDVIAKVLSKILQGKPLRALPTEEQWNVHFPGVPRTYGRVTGITPSGIYLEYEGVNPCFLRYEHIEEMRGD